MAKARTIATTDDLRTGADADRVELEGVGRVEDHADVPAQSWEQDNAGDVLLTPRRPASRQVTVPAEGGLILMMKIKGQGAFRAVFETGAVNVSAPPSRRDSASRQKKRRCTSGGWRRDHG